MGGEKEVVTEVVVIGGGLSGICAATHLRRSGIPFVVLEKNHSLGGTWLENTYPGSGCDVMSHLYSFSFRPNPGWSRMWSKQEEILDYLNFVVDAEGVRESFHFNRAVTTAEWLEEESMWRITATATAAGGGMEEGETMTVRATACICGTGQLNAPSFPPLPGVNGGTFKGEAEFHTARWRHDVSLKGKRVVVLGNGASAIQFLPEIAPDCEKLTVIQRTPSHIIPKSDSVYSAFVLFLFRYVPLVLWLYRCYLYWSLEYGWLGFKERFAKYNKWYTKSVEEHMVKSIPDGPKADEIKSKILPDYPLGCKRILLSDHYIPLLARDNVELVTSPATEVTEDGVMTEEGLLPADVVIYSTGFRSSDFLASIKVVGRTRADGGEEVLSKRWGTVPRAWHGMAMPGYPNFFLTYGPNTNLGHNSIVFVIEVQIDHILTALKAVLPSSRSRRSLGAGRKARVVEVRGGAMREYIVYLEKELKLTVWHNGCNSWYKNKDGVIVNNMPSSTLAYWYRLRSVDFKKDYELS